MGESGVLRGPSVETVWSVPGLEKKLGGVLYEAVQCRFDSRIISTLAAISPRPQLKL